MNESLANCPRPDASADALAAAAQKAVQATIQAGAAALIAEPWRVERIIRGAETMTFQELAREVARRRALPPPADFNRALALAQLARALQRPGFAACWSERLRLNGPHHCVTQRKLAASSTSPPL
jgi:hypothetical protein